MLIVSDTSPIRALHAVGCVSLLKSLYQSVYIPPAVELELAHSPAGLPPILIAEYEFLQVRSAGQIVPEASNLDPGEREAISLARELGAEWLLIDERRGQRVAKFLGIQTVGILGMLIAAKREKLVPAVAPILKELRTCGRFFISDELMREVLDVAGERDVPS